MLEALRAGTGIERLYLAEGQEPASALEEMTRRARAASAIVTIVPRQALDRLAGGGHHQGVVAQVAEYEYATIEELLAIAAKRNEPPLLVVLDSLQDPQNLGALIRTAEAVGAHGIILPRHRSVGVTGTVVKASAGAIEHLRVARVSSLQAGLGELKLAGVWVVGLSAEAPQDYDRYDYRVPTALIVGAEGAGISRLVAERCDTAVRLPQRGRVGSLNAAVAGSIVLYHAWRQRSEPAPTPAQPE